MIEIALESPIGILTVLDEAEFNNKIKNTQNKIILQLSGIKLDNSLPCVDTNDIILFLQKNPSKNIFIFNLIEITNELYIEINKSLLKGINIFLNKELQ